jgi:cellobiose phosphorylase
MLKNWFSQSNFLVHKLLKKIKRNAMKIENASGLTFEFNDTGAIKSIHLHPIRISLKKSSPGTPITAGIYLRSRSKPLEFISLLTPGFPVTFNWASAGSCSWMGKWKGLKYQCSLMLSEADHTWKWDIEIWNELSVPVELDLVWMQDVGLKHIHAGLVNEYYVGQYLERIILEDSRYGKVICCRQNMAEATGNPWLMLVCRNGAGSASTDGMQFFGRTFRGTGIPEGLVNTALDGEYAGESPVVALQEKPFILAPGEQHTSSFLGIYQPDHPEATSLKDLDLIEMSSAFKFRTEMSSPSEFQTEMSSRNLFLSSQLFPSEDLTEIELTKFFGPERLQPEHNQGTLLSFFTSAGTHIVLKAKEILTDRPHAHILQANTGLVPDEGTMSTTCFMSGVFNSHLSQGNTNFNVLLSICTSQFNQDWQSGQRLILTLDGQEYLLGVPSAFEMGLNYCRWIYRLGGYIFQVRTWTSKKHPQINLEFKVLKGDPVKVTIAHDFDPLNGWQIRNGKKCSESVAIPEQGSMILSRFPGARFRMMVQEEKNEMSSHLNIMPSHWNEMSSHWNEMDSRFQIDINQISSFCMSFLGEVAAKSEFITFQNPDAQFAQDRREADEAWAGLSLGLHIESEHPDLAAIRQVLPWYGMNALVHYLTPYGLEQFGGAAWGTRDVSQGPVDFLLALEKYDEARQVMLTIFSNQNPDGGWPQWWMFDRYFNIRAHESHGDIFYWCIIALSQYIRVTGDAAILDESLPYYHAEGPAVAERTPLSEHIDRLVRMIIDSFIPGTALVPFGGGDWNDSLQPVSQSLASRMISSWTVEMNFQAFSSLADIFLLTGQQDRAAEMMATCDRIKADFNRYLVKDGIVAGYGLVEGPGKIDVLLHPADGLTGVHYSILPMERGILSGIFTREQALFHQELIEKHLKGPDGARLMDKPLKYRGGIRKIFQRAETSTFFGREIGLMYVHEHIRYAESLARTGKAEAFVKALRQAIPVGYRDVVPVGDIRQANCYYSSSDVHFKNRYEADEHYHEVIAGQYTLRGGWRVYSSGPGIYTGIVIRNLFGIRMEASKLILDPVMPRAFSGTTLSLKMQNVLLRISYIVTDEECSPKRIVVNGVPVAFDLEDHPYRKGGAVIEKKAFLALLDQDENLVEISL